MTFLIVLGCILAFLAILSLLRIGVSAEYADTGIKAKAHVGPFSLTLYPAKRKTEKEKKKKRQEDKEKKKRQKAEEKPKPGVFEELKAQLPAIKTALSRLKRKLLIKELTIYYLAGGEDPAQAALSFGGVSAGYGIITAFLENNFRIKKRDLRANVDFNAEKPYIYVKLKLSLAVWEAVYVGFNLLMSMAKAKKVPAKSTVGV